MNSDQQPRNDLEPDAEQNPLLFYAAYLPGPGKERRYMSNGKTGKAKGLRLWKTEEAAQRFFKDQFDQGRISREAFEQVVIHPVDGKIAIPEETPIKKYNLPRRLPWSAPDHLKPITTLHKPSVPTAVELLEDYQRRKKRRRRN